MAYIDKLLNKFNKAKSAINTVKGIQSRIQSINYTSAIDALGIEVAQAEEYIDARRTKLEEQLKSSNSSKTYSGKKPTGRTAQMIYPLHDRLENYIVFNIRPRRARGGFTNHPVHKSRSIAMYVPDAVISQAAVTYRNEGINTFSRGATDLMSSILTAETSKDVFNAENADVVKKMATKAIQNAANTMTGGLSNLKFGRASNPMQEQMLDGIPFRSWDFTFDFWPKSRQEADEVNNIIYAFRISMLPDAYGENFDLIGFENNGQDETVVLGHAKEQAGSAEDVGDTNASYFNYPNVFEISFEGTMKNKVDGFLPAVCTNAQVDYTGGQKFSTFADGQPVHIQLTLNFLEIKTMTLGNYESISNSGLVDGKGYFSQGSTADRASSGEFLDQEHAMSERLRSYLPEKRQGDASVTHGNAKGFVYKDTIDPPKNPGRGGGS